MCGGWYIRLEKKYLVSFLTEQLYGLRRFIHEVMECSLWLEMNFQYSKQAYNALDMYLSTFQFGMKPPKKETWYLLNAWQDPMYRPEVKPEEWWRCVENMIRMGQREAFSELKLMSRMKLISFDKA